MRDQYWASLPTARGKGQKSDGPGLLAIETGLAKRYRLRSAVGSSDDRRPGSLLLPSAGENRARAAPTVLMATAARVHSPRGSGPRRTAATAASGAVKLGRSIFGRRVVGEAA